PVVGWSVVPAKRGSVKHTRLPSQPQPRRCGNLDPVHPSAVFHLAPGGSRVMEVDPPRFSRPGKYRMVFSYRNAPGMTWHGEYSCDARIMEQIRHSTPCELRSNEILLMVKH